MPSTTSPSDGMVSPASTTTTSPTLRLVPGTLRKLRRSAPIRSFACVSVRVRLSASACALPRPSATASAKLANSTVNHSHNTIWNSKPRFAPPVTMSRINMTVVSAVTTSSTNITGFFIRVRGSSLTKAEPIAGHHDLGVEQRRDRHLFAHMRGIHRRGSEFSSMRTRCRRSLRSARRSGRARAPGRTSVRR